MRKGASAEGRAKSLKIRRRVSSRSTPALFLVGTRSTAWRPPGPALLGRKTQGQSPAGGGGSDRGHNLIAARVQQPLYLGAGDRRAEQIPLHLGTTQFAQQFHLRHRLDALGRRRHVARGSYVHDGLDNRGRSSRAGNVFDKAAIDLDLVEGKTLQIAQRGIAGAKVVQRYPYPQLSQLVQQGERHFIVTDQDRLGNLKFQPARREARGCECRGHIQRQGLAFELNRRDIDRDPDVIRPARGLDARGVEYPVTELVDETGLFGDRDEFRGRYHAPLGVAPTQQRFAAADLVVPEIHQRLIVDLEPAIHDRLTQLKFQYPPCLDAGIHV